MDIGFLGLGHMGRAIAGNLVKAGHRVSVWNRSPGPAAALAAEGAIAVSTPGEALQGEAVVSMFGTDEALREVVLADGVLASAKPGLVHVNMATISVAFAADLAAIHRDHGLGYVAAPVFGRPDAAAVAKLHVLVAGANADVDTVKPLLQAVGQSLWPFGEAPENANLVKLSGNFAIASMLETLGEIGALVQAHGLAAGAVFDMLTSTLFDAPVYKSYAPMIAERRFEPVAFKLPLGQKDMRLVLAAGEARNVSMPFAGVLRDHFIEAIAAGDGEKDWSALGGQAFRRAGLA